MSDTSKALDESRTADCVTTRPGRASAQHALHKIQQTLEWENCEEDSEQFQRVADACEEAMAAEELGSNDDEDAIDDSEAEEDSASSDESYESSFVTDNSSADSMSGSESDGEREWRPKKRACSHADTPGFSDETELPAPTVEYDTPVLTEATDMTVPTEVTELPAPTVVYDTPVPTDIDPNTDVPVPGWIGDAQVESPRSKIRRVLQGYP